MMRLVVSLVVATAFIPFLVHADAAVPTQNVPSNSVQGTGLTGGSGQVLSVLQPAGGSSSDASSLQSAGAGGTGAAQSGQENIQQGGLSNQAQLLIGGDADQPHQAGQSLVVTWLGYILIVLLGTTVLTALVWLLQRRRWLSVTLPL